MGTMNVCNISLNISHAVSPRGLENGVLRKRLEIKLHVKVRHCDATWGFNCEEMSGPSTLFFLPQQELSFCPPLLAPHILTLANAALDPFDIIAATKKGRYDAVPPPALSTLYSHDSPLFCPPILHISWVTRFPTSLRRQTP